jgi:hypothetical protein
VQPRRRFAAAERVEKLEAVMASRKQCNVSIADAGATPAHGDDFPLSAPAYSRWMEEKQNNAVGIPM